MSEKTRLNLGCGDNYKPGYVNLDKHNSSIIESNDK